MSTPQDYQDLVTSFHSSRPKFMAIVGGVTAPPAEAQNFLRTLPSQFDLDTAIGVQLDQVGEWIGRTRYVKQPIAGVYFTLDDPLRGFDLGVWKGPNDNDAGLTRLDDETYRLLLRAKIASNNWDGTLEGAKNALSIIFPDGETRIFILDNQDMSMVFGVSGTIPSILFLALLSLGYVPLKPEGVQAVYAITSVDGAPLFGFDVDNEFIGGFDSGSWAVTPEYYFG
jgi:hypothetical protein